MVKDKLTFYPPDKERDLMEIYHDFRYDYLFTHYTREELVLKYDISYDHRVKLVKMIKAELGVDSSMSRWHIQKKIEKGVLKVEEWL